MNELISINGHITNTKDAKISVLDRGLLFGDSVFETIVCFGNNIINVEGHLVRLRKSGKIFGFEIPWTDQELTKELLELINKKPHKKGLIRLMITRGEGLGLATGSHLTPNKIIIYQPAPVQNEVTYEKGLSLMSTKLPFTERGALAKSGNYLRSIVALKEARTFGFDDIMWVNSSSEITESSVANIFFLGRIGEQLEVATPCESAGLLLGLTRERIIRLLENAGIKVTVRTIYHDEIPMFDEAFLCSTVRGLVPINAIDHHKLHTTRTNATFAHFTRLYDTWVESQLGYRVDWNTGDETI